MYAQSGPVFPPDGWTPVLGSTAVNDSVDAVNRVLTMQYDHVLSLRQWGFEAEYANRTGLLDRLGVRTTARSILREDTRSITTETFTLARVQRSLGLGSLYGLIDLFGASYHTGPPRGYVLINDPNTKIDGYATAGAGVMADNGSYLRVSGGVTRLSQLEGGAFGTLVRGAGELKPLDLAEGHRLHATGSLDERFLPERDQRFSTNGIHAQLYSDLGDGIANELTASLGNSRRNFFFDNALDSVRSVKQTRHELSLDLRERLYYPHVVDGLNTAVILQYSPRSVTRRSDAEQVRAVGGGLSSMSSLLLPNALSASSFSVEGQFDYAVRSERPAVVTLSIRYQEEDEKSSLITGELQGLSNAEIRRVSDILEEASFYNASTTFTLGSILPLTSQSALNIQGTARIFRHSTSSEANVDDRDDQLFSALVRYESSELKPLTARVELRLSQSRLVYLDAARSAQNARTQTIGLMASTVYGSSNMRNTLGAEVFAQYTVLDYYKDLPQLQSIGNYLLRGLSVRDSLTLELGTAGTSTPMFLEASADTRLSERGSYDPDNFLERREQLITEVGSEVLLGIRLIEGVAPLSVRLGARSFFYDRKGAGLTRQDLQTLEQQWRAGPVISVSAIRSEASGPEIFAALWYAFVTTENSTGGVLRQQHPQAHVGVRWFY